MKKRIIKITCMFLFGAVIFACKENKPQTIAMTGFTVSPTSITLFYGGTPDSQQITATAEPENATDVKFTWYSENGNVAAVSQTGLVTATGAGSTNIVVTSGDKTQRVPVDVVDLQITEFILAAEVTNRQAYKMVIDNAARQITFDMEEGESKTGVNIRLTLADGVTMESPATAQADYDLTNTALIKLLADDRQVVFTVKAGVYTKWEIKNGKFYLDGEHVFLKIGKPLLNLANEQAVDKLISYLDVYKQKNYTVIELNCHWVFFDTDGDGEIDFSLAPLNKLIDAIYDKGMLPSLSVETYPVGSLPLPLGFWTRYPDADAIDSNGEEVIDTEYEDSSGFGSRVVSIFHLGYLETTRKYIRNLASGIDTRKILWFETTVEPQYMGTINMCYSDAAKKEYDKWRTANNITDEASQMPTTFPIPQSFIENETWNKFRAQWLSEWVNGDAAAYREIAGQNAYVAVDYLDATQELNRTGDCLEFLTHLTCADIIQVNWSWYYPTNSPNQKAYDRVRQAMFLNGKNWAITEHMTFNGHDFERYDEESLKLILENTLTNGTRFGWEFTNVMPNSVDNFCLYNDDFSGKSVINTVDEHWEYWLRRVEEIEKNNE